MLTWYEEDTNDRCQVLGLKSKYEALGAKIISAAAEWCDLANFHPCCMERAIFPGKGREGAATEWCDMQVVNLSIPWV